MGKSSLVEVGETVKNHRDPSPPPYSFPSNATAMENPIAPEITLGNDFVPSEENVTIDEAITHLKLIAAINRLRRLVMGSDKLFGISDGVTRRFSDPRRQAQAEACVKEKRWAVYVARAVERFTTWWQTRIPGGNRPDSSSLGRQTTRIVWSLEKMPPLDILMVWHAYMLNPRVFLEDCLRHSKMAFWASGLPWKLIAQSIDTDTCMFDPGKKARIGFERKCGRPWDNLSEGSIKVLPCLRCKDELAVPWTEASFGCDPDVAFAHCKGFADKSFRIVCLSCKYSITHEAISVQTFRSDVQKLLIDGLQMPGTLLAVNGMPASDQTADYVSYPNRLIKEGIRSDNLQLTDLTLNESSTIETIRDYFESFIKDKSFIRRLNGNLKSLNAGNSYIAKKVSLRNMLSRYWENPSIFSINLVGAVIRQGTFMEKAEQIGWIKSTKLQSTVAHFFNKYSNFFQIISKNKGHAVVPTLDIDFFWHTHQLSPALYYNFSTSWTGGIFVGHDDKVDELKLNDAFIWTSLQYQKLTGGGLYSECTCWYCDAVRESHNRGVSQLISSSPSHAKTNATNLHKKESSAQRAENNEAHISSHNSIRIQARVNPRAIEKRTTELISNWEKSKRASHNPTQDQRGHAFSGHA